MEVRTDLPSFAFWDKTSLCSQADTEMTAILLPQIPQLLFFKRNWTPHLRNYNHALAFIFMQRYNKSLESLQSVCMACIYLKRMSTAIDIGNKQSRLGD